MAKIQIVAGFERHQPMAVENLEQNPLAEGDDYAGDLLKAVLGIEELVYWVEHTDICPRMRAVAKEDPLN